MGLDTGVPYESSAEEDADELTGLDTGVPYESEDPEEPELNEFAEEIGAEAGVP